MDIEFVDEPPQVRRGPQRTQWDDIVPKLAANEGQWARVAHWDRAATAAQYASDFRHRRRLPKCFEPYRWDAQSASNPAGGADLYLKCLGPVE